MSSYSNREGKSFTNPLVFLSNYFSDADPEAKIINYSEEAKYELITDSYGKLVSPSRVDINLLNIEKEHVPDKSFFGENDMIIIAIVLSALVLLTMYFYNAHQAYEIQKAHLEKQVQQEKLALEYELAQQANKIEQDKMALQYQIAEQANQLEQDRLFQQSRQFEQTQLTKQYEQTLQYKILEKAQNSKERQQVQQYSLAERAQSAREVEQTRRYNLAERAQSSNELMQTRKYELTKQAQAASSKTTSTVNFSMGF